MRDISDIIKAEYARSVEKLSEIMIASTSHDMRTPLNTIVNMLLMIKDKATDLEMLQWLRVAANSTSLL
jgi:K+-sensing histidine kinase KdpD